MIRIPPPAIAGRPRLDATWCCLDDLSPARIHALFRLRVAIFVVEQACAYAEIDGRDENGNGKANMAAAYPRALSEAIAELTAGQIDPISLEIETAADELATLAAERATCTTARAG